MTFGVKFTFDKINPTDPQNQGAVATLWTSLEREDAKRTQDSNSFQNALKVGVF